MKKKKLVKLALRHPELYSPAELAYFQLWLRTRKERKFTKRKGFYNRGEETTDK